MVEPQPSKLVMTVRICSPLHFLREPKLQFKPFYSDLLYQPEAEVGTFQVLTIW